LPIYLVNKDEYLKGSTPKRRNELTMPTNEERIAVGLARGINGGNYIDSLAEKMNSELTEMKREEVEGLLCAYLEKNSTAYPSISEDSHAVGKKIPKE
jgi:hypothetical protein